MTPTFGEPTTDSKHDEKLHWQVTIYNAVCGGPLICQTDAERSAGKPCMREWNLGMRTDNLIHRMWSKPSARLPTVETGSQYTKNLPLALAIGSLFIYEIFTIMPFSFNNVSIISVLLETLTNFNGLLFNSEISAINSVILHIILILLILHLLISYKLKL